MNTFISPKKQRVETCKKLYSNLEHTILSGTEDEPKHVRIHNLCDLWPTTGTIWIFGEAKPRKKQAGIDKLAEILGVSIHNPEDDNKNK